MLSTNPSLAFNSLVQHRWLQILGVLYGFLDVADLRRYIYEMMVQIRTTALSMYDMCGNDNGRGQSISKTNGHNETVHPAAL